MRMLWIVYTGSAPDRVTRALHDLGAPGWTRMGAAYGAGMHGRVEGTRAWPGEETVFMSVMPGDVASTVVDGLARVQVLLDAGERLHVAVLPVERFQ
jgi:hypothetical protein